MSPFIKQWRTVQSFWTDRQWLGNRMLFVSGPRQVGKTTLVTSTICTDKKAYFNWDNRKVRMQYQADPDFISNIDFEWICLDEIHKRPKWKDILKGFFDTYRERYRFVVTGSARLETFKKSGDSLVGRYFQTHLFPINLPDLFEVDFSPPEDATKLLERAADVNDTNRLEALLHMGGFPEPYFSGSESFRKRWSQNHRDLIIQEDLRDLTRVIEIDKVEALLEMLQPSIGSPVSYRNLANDLETTHGSIKRWLQILNRVQLIFPVSPYSKKIRRAYKQERKWYYTDWAAAGEELFENYVASSLHRAATLFTDRFGDRMSLHFVRTHDGAEVDFLLCKEQKPWLLIEAKEGSPQPTSAAYRFSELLQVPCAIVTRKRGIFKRMTRDSKHPIYCISWGKLGQLLP